MLAIRRAGATALRYAALRKPGETPLARGDGRHICPCHRAVAAAGGPLRAARHSSPSPMASRCPQAATDGIPASLPDRDGPHRRAVRPGRPRCQSTLPKPSCWHGRTGEHFAACVTDADGDSARVQLLDLPWSPAPKSPMLAPGQRLDLRLEAADPAKRRLTFVPAAV